ncbi:MAG: chemotaxis protein CheD [Oscillospiraceae bacterium]|nr:chemotaxis protein CheD [Oscillospiraceae bacterium]
MKTTYNIGISDWKIGVAGDVLVTYALGSCVGICMYDKIHKIGGLSHIMLPDSNSIADISGLNRMKFADTAIPDMYQKLVQQGASNMTCKIAGGALMFATSSDKFNIGERNVVAVRAALSKLRVPIIASDTGLNFGRTVFFYPENGVVEVKSTTQGTKQL